MLGLKPPTSCWILKIPPEISRRYATWRCVFLLEMHFPAAHHFWYLQYLFTFLTNFSMWPWKIRLYNLPFKVEDVAFLLDSFLTVWSRDFSRDPKQHLEIHWSIGMGPAYGKWVPLLGIPGEIPNLMQCGFCKPGENPDHIVPEDAAN